MSPRGVLFGCAALWTAVAATVEVGWGGAEAATAPTVRIGSLEVPADCALAKKEHPRLLFTKADLPDIRRRIRHPALRPLYERLKRTVDEQLARGEGRALSALVPLGLLYHITGDEKYGQACREATLKASFGVYACLGAYGYDLAYDLMTPDERRLCEEKMLAFIRQKYRWRGRFIQCVGLWGSGLEDDEVAATLSRLHAWLLEHRKHLEGWAAERGGDGNSHGYIGQHEYVGTMGALQAWRAATGEDLFKGMVWVRGMAPYYLYHILPGTSHTVHVGINSWYPSNAPRETGANNFTSIAQSEWKCGFTGWWIKNVVIGTRHDYEILGTHWGPIIWYDPEVPEIPREKLPEDMLFITRGYLCMRSGWGPDDTFVHFHCGRFEGDSRNNPDNNSFVIYRKKYLACDSGTRGLNNPGHPANSGWPGKHHNLYFQQTIAHNTISVGTDDIKGLGGCIAVCGGQVSRVPAEWLKMYGLPVTYENRYTRQAGRIVAYETHPAFCYAVGDARCSYSPYKVKAFTRQFLYVRPGTVVIYDRVSAVRPEDAKRWYLHLMSPPDCLDGPLEPDKSVHPEGHWLARGRTLRSAYGGSALFSRTVLPEKAIIRVLGGEGHRFEVNGINYTMSPAWWKNVGTQRYQDLIGLGWGRVEVEPAEKRADDEFLHVLWATDDAAAEMFDVEKVERDGMVGVRFTADGVSVEVLFARRGPVSARMTLSKGGRTLVDRPLASKVEDVYAKWESDPRFTEWMTNDFMRPLIGAKEVDAWRKAHSGKPSAGGLARAREPLE